MYLIFSKTILQQTTTKYTLTRGRCLYYVELQFKHTFVVISL